MYLHLSPPVSFSPRGKKPVKVHPPEFRPNALRDFGGTLKSARNVGQSKQGSANFPYLPSCCSAETTIGDCNARPFSPASGSRCIGAAAEVDYRVDSQVGHGSLNARNVMKEANGSKMAGEDWLTDILSTFIVAEMSRRVPFLCHLLFLRFGIVRFRSQLSRRPPFCIHLPDNVNGQVTAEPVRTELPSSEETPARWWSLFENLRSCYVIFENDWARNCVKLPLLSTLGG